MGKVPPQFQKGGSYAAGKKSPKAARFSKSSGRPSVCAKCGAKLPPGAKTCPKCGAPVKNSAVAKAEASVKGKKGSKGKSLPPWLNK